MEKIKKIANSVPGKRGEDLGVTPLQMQALDYIKNNPNMPVRGFSDYFLMSPSSVSQLTDRLFALGLIDRKSDPDDRRSVLVFLTKKGEQFLKKLKKEMIKSIDFMSKYMNIDDIEHMIRIHKNMLKRMAENNKQSIK
ncbi:MAG: MarR family transcriptional regulator [Candidatus Moraniibacteriota bacterium]